MAAIHHYVPRFLLKNFCSTAPKIWAYDKATDRSFETNVQNVAGERDFYEAEIGDKVVSLEAGLSDMESKTKAVIDRILLERSIASLSEDDRLRIALFVAVQMRRVPNQRESLRALTSAFKKVMDDRFDPALMDGYVEMTTEDAKVHSIMSLAEPNPFTPHILNKTWLLFETEGATPFYISDNPVALQNQVKSASPFEGNLGLAVPGIEIYMPISSAMTLGFYCRSHEEGIRNTMDRMRTSVVRDAGFPMDFGPLLDWMRAFRKGTPLKSTPDNVLNHNSLQVQQAERYVFSSEPDFSLVKSMIADEPQFRIGPRPRIS